LENLAFYKIMLTIMVEPEAADEKHGGALHAE
jgi:hypothetical protein